MKKNIGIFFICLCLFNYQSSVADNVIGCDEVKGQPVCGSPALIQGANGSIMGMQAPKIYKNMCFLKEAGAGLIPKEDCNISSTYGVPEKTRIKIDIIIEKFRKKLDVKFGNNTEKKKEIIKKVLQKIEEKALSVSGKIKSSKIEKLMNVLQYLKAQLSK